MPQLPIKKYPEDILLKKTVKVKDPLTAEIQDLILNMISTMHKENGVGLAAPQVGSGLRICVINEGGNDYVLINPVITARSREKVVSEEGCLSFPGHFFFIERPEKVQVRYLNKDGKSAKIKSGGLLARALQHEIDHLEGILIIDHLKKKERTKFLNSISPHE